jgi:hypothetical protein
MSMSLFCASSAYTLNPQRLKQTRQWQFSDSIETRPSLCVHRRKNLDRQQPAVLR